MLTLSNITLQKGHKVLLDQANCTLFRGEIIGIVGDNGCGKSTLMQAIAQQQEVDAGNIQCDLTADDISYFDQSLPQSAQHLSDFVKAGDQAWLAVHQQLQHAQTTKQGLLIAQCHQELQQLDGYRIEARCERILKGLAFHPSQWNQPLTQLSGGWQMRAKLAQLLMSPAPLLLLDEPTNHLDLAAIHWLEQWLEQCQKTCLIISHDRCFLDAICSHIVHYQQQSLRKYRGNFSAFAEQYQQQQQHQQQQRHQALAQQAQLRQFIARFGAKATKAKQAQSRVKALNKLVIAPAPVADTQYHFRFHTPKPLASPLLQCHGDIGRDAVLIQQANLHLAHGDKLGLLGANGCGKSTLLETLAQRIPLLQGNIHQHSKLVLGYYSQDQLTHLSSDLTAEQQLQQHFPQLSSEKLRQLLGQFGFGEGDANRPIHSFSGGEKARLALAQLIQRQPHVLVLDEPTNHLDMPAREALIQALQQFDGACVIVSHDRHFLSSTTNQLCLVAQQQLLPFAGDIDDYLQQLQHAANVTPSRHKKTSNKQQHKLEKQLQQAQKKLEKINHQLADTSLYDEPNASLLQQLQQQQQQTQQQIETLEQSWYDSLE